MGPPKWAGGASCMERGDTISRNHRHQSQKTLTYLQIPTPGERIDSYLCKSLHVQHSRRV